MRAHHDAGMFRYPSGSKGRTCCYPRRWAAENGEPRTKTAAQDPPPGGVKARHLHPVK